MILRLRGRTDLGTGVMDVLHRYAPTLAARGCTLVIVSAGPRTQEQLRVTGVTGVIEPENVHAGDERGAPPSTRLRRRRDVDHRPAGRRRRLVS